MSKIKGVSDRRRLPRLGTIRLGIKLRSQKTGKEYPKETAYFVVPDEVARVYGERPTELEIMLPLNEQESVFPQSYKFYGSSRGLKCQGNGELAMYVDENTGEMLERECPCELLDQGKCKQTGTLMVMIPRVSVGGVYQIRTSSYNSIVDVNSGLDYVSALIGRFAMVPLKLRRTPIETHHNGSKQTHYTLQVIFDYDIDTLNKLREDNMRVLEHPRYELPAPKDENPEFDPVDQVVDLEDEEEEPQNVTPQQPEEKPNVPEPPPPAGSKKRPRPSAKDFEYLNLAGELKKQIKQLSDGYEEGYYAVLKSCGIEHVDEAPDEKTRKKVIAGLRKAVKMLKESQEKKPKQKSNQPTTVFEQSVQFYQETMGEEFDKVLEQFHVLDANNLPEGERDDFLVKCGRRLEQIDGG
jgi:hypothetical protein